MLFLTVTYDISNMFYIIIMEKKVHKNLIIDEQSIPQNNGLAESASMYIQWYFVIYIYGHIVKYLMPDHSRHANVDLSIYGTSKKT